MSTSSKEPDEPLVLLLSKVQEAVQASTAASLWSSLGWRHVDVEDDEQVKEAVTDVMTVLPTAAGFLHWASPKLGNQFDENSGWLLLPVNGSWLLLPVKGCWLLLMNGC